MSSIDRVRFTRDLATAQINLRTAEGRATLQAAGLRPSDVRAIAGEDRVIRGQSELEALYDRLTALDAAAPREGASVDRARALYDRVMAARTTSAGTGDAASPAAVPPAPGAGAAPPPVAAVPLVGSARPRTTGVTQTSPIVLTTPPVIQLTRADYVRTLGASSARQLDAAARRNVTGPEADAQRRIRAMTEQTAERVHAMEEELGRLPPGPERAALRERIDAEVNMFENTLAAESAYLRQQARAGERQGGPMEQLTRALPPLIRRSVEERGLVIPGVPGAIAPRTSSPYGVDWKLRF